MIQNKNLLKLLKKEHQAYVTNENNYSNCSVTGIVVDTDDPLQMGRLRVFCPALNDDPAKLHHLPWSIYISPFGGSISNSQFLRGTGKYEASTSGATAYGMWSIPEQGAKVLVGCIDGDERKRYWIGCIHEHQETHTLFHGRYDWSSASGTPDGPLSSTGDPLEPLYSNSGKAFNEDRDSREWKTRQADYQATAVDKSVGQNPNNEKTNYQDEQFEHISEAEQDDWVKGIVGGHGYDWSGNKALGSFKSSRAYGWVTPGGHAISMDDRAFNSRIRIRSATGHQIIMDDTNERIYVSSNEGKSYIELDSNGNIDVYGERRLSFHAEKDINFTTDETFRVKANKGIHLYAGETTGQIPLDDNKPEDGEIRLHSTADTHIMSEDNLRVLTKNDSLSEIGGSSFTSIAGEMFLQTENDINIIINDGDYNVSVNGDYNHHTSGTTSIFSGFNNEIQAVHDTEIYSYTGKMDVGSQLNLTVKSYTQDINLESIEQNIKLESNEGMNHITMRDSGTAIFSFDNISMYSTENVDFVVNPDLGISDNPGDITYQGNPISGCLFNPELLNIRFNDRSADFGIPDDVKFDLASSGINESIQTVNDSLNQIEFRFNQAMQNIHETFGNISGLDSFPLTFDIPTLNVPSLNVEFALDPIELPEFNFDMCVDFSNLVTVDTFNPLPNNSFININTDLGGWTANNIRQWSKRQERQLDNSIDSFNSIPDSAQIGFETALQNINISVNNIKKALDNLIDVNVTDNGELFDSYTLGIGDFKDASILYNEEVKDYNDSHGSTIIEPIDDLINELNSHERNIKPLNDSIQNDPSAVEGFDYSGLSDVSDMYGEYINRLEQII